MANNITNQITFGTDAAAMSAFHRMLEDMCMPGKPLGSFDFNKLIPMPESLKIESGGRTDKGLKLFREFCEESAAISLQGLAMPEAEHEQLLANHLQKWDQIKADDPETWALGEKAYQNIQQHGAPTWYEWCNRNWGTKWNSYEFSRLGADADTMQFYTAWSGIPRLMKFLSEKYPEQTITYRWADEDIGCNVGKLVLRAGEVIEKNIPTNGSREAYEMAAEIMGIDLADFDLHLTADKSTYRYCEPAPLPKQQRAGKKAKGQER